MKKYLILPIASLGAIAFSSCANNKPEPVQLTLISEWGSFSDEYPTTKLTLNTMKSQKLKDVKGFSNAIPKPFFPEVMEFKGWAFDYQGTKSVPEDYVIDGNTTFYAKYERNTIEKDTSYIVYNYNTVAATGVEGRNIVAFKCKDEGKNLTKDSIEIPGFTKDTDYNIVIDPPTFNKEYTKVTIEYRDGMLDHCGNSVIKIKHKIDDLRLASGNALDNLYAPGNGYVTAMLLADGFTTISDCAFDSCFWLMAISLPNTIKNIGYGAFNTCYSLNFLEMPKDLETIGESAFFGCATMEHVYFNDGLKTIKKNAFYGCVSLREIHIPDSVTTLGVSAFGFCLLNNDLVIGKGIKILPEDCFADNYYLQKVTIPNNIIELGTACFSHCDSLTELNFEDGGNDITDPTKIDCPFQYCISLTSVKIPNRFKTLGKNTFQHSLLYELDLSATSTSEPIDIGYSPFGADTPLVYGYGKIVVPNNLVNAYKDNPSWSAYKDIIVGK